MCSQYIHDRSNQKRHEIPQQWRTRYLPRFCYANLSFPRPTAFVSIFKTHTNTCIYNSVFELEFKARYNASQCHSINYDAVMVNEPWRTWIEYASRKQRFCKNSLTWFFEETSRCIINLSLAKRNIENKKGQGVYQRAAVRPPGPTWTTMFFNTPFSANPLMTAFTVLSSIVLINRRENIRIVRAILLSWGFFVAFK